MKLTTDEIKKIILEELTFILNESEKLSRRKFLKMATAGAASSVLSPKTGYAKDISYVKGGINLDPNSDWNLNFDLSSLKSACLKYDIVLAHVITEPNPHGVTPIILGGKYQDKEKYSSVALKDFDAFWHSKRSQINAGGSPIDISHPEGFAVIEPCFRRSKDWNGNTHLTQYHDVPYEKQKNNYRIARGGGKVIYMYRIIEDRPTKALKVPKAISINAYAREKDMDLGDVKSIDITKSIISLEKH